MKKISIGNKEVIHLVGIGGIGMSGLAHIMKMMGFSVQGSDMNFNKNIENCKKLGIRVFIGHKISNTKKATILVKSSAIKKNNIELVHAIKKKLPIYSRAEMLANIISLKKKYFSNWLSWKNNNHIVNCQNFIISKFGPDNY